MSKPAHSPSPLPPFVVKLVSPEIWPTICESGFIPFSALDQQDGFMHLSTEEQMIETANKYYTAHDPVLGLKIPTPLIKSNLKWEPAANRNNDLFPHLYGSCPADRISMLLILRQNVHGAFVVSASRPPALAVDTDFSEF